MIQNHSTQVLKDGSIGSRENWKGSVLAISTSFLLRTSLGVILVVSGWLKFERPYDFLINTYDYEILGLNGGIWVASTLPWLEFTTGICLITGIFRWGAYASSIALGTIFSGVQISAIWRGLDIACGCFGGGTDPIDFGTIILSIGFMLLSFAACFIDAWVSGGNQSDSLV